MDKKRVLFVSLSFAGGGAERVAALLLQYLNRREFEPLLVVFQDRFYYPVPPDISFTCLHKKGAYDLFRLTWRLAKIYEKEKPDTVVSFLNYTNLIAVAAQKLSRAKPRLILTEHNQTSIDLMQESFSFTKAWAIPRMYPKADAVICVSRGVADDLVANFGVSPHKTKVIYDPVDIDHILTQASEDIEQPCFAQEESPTIITMGRLAVQKGHPHLLRAFAQVREKHPCRLVILGEGDERQALESLARELGIEKEVDFLGFQENPFKYLARAELFVLSSLYEGFAMAIVEAMACGIPVISTRCPSGPDEIITDGVNGLLVPVADEAALAEAMLRLLKDKGLAAKLAQAGRKRAEDFAITKIVKEYELLL